MDRAAKKNLHFHWLPTFGTYGATPSSGFGHPFTFHNFFPIVEQRHAPFQQIA